MRENWSLQPTVAVGLVIIGCIAAIGVLAPVIVDADPSAIAPTRRLLSPSYEHWFGTDALGRDLFSRVLHGSRVSLTVGVSVAFFATVIGLVCGLAAGYVRSIDSPVMRVMDGMMSIPPILLAIALMALMGSSMRNVIIAITVADVPRVARLVRSVVLSVREQPFVEAAIACGSSDWKIITKHVLPNTIPAVAVQSTFICAGAIIIEAVLAFIGAGTPPSIPSWGNIMSDGRTVWQLKPHIIVFPAIFLSMTVLAINLVGDGLRDTLDPRFVRKTT